MMGQFTPENPIFDGKNPWVSCRFFPFCQSIDPTDELISFRGVARLKPTPRIRPEDGLMLKATARGRR